MLHAPGLAPVATLAAARTDTPFRSFNIGTHLSQFKELVLLVALIRPQTPAPSLPLLNLVSFKLQLL